MNGTISGSKFVFKFLFYLSIVSHAFLMIENNMRVTRSFSTSILFLSS